MNPSIKQLQDKNTFIETEIIVQNEPMPFFKKYMNKLTSWSICFYLILIIFAGLFGLSFANQDNTGIFATAPFFVFLIILPIHEIIHAIVYKLFGAKNVGFKIVWKQFVVYTYANHDVVNSRQMKSIASAPFIVISTIFLLLTFLGEGELRIFASFAGLLHALLCLGDLAILNYLQINKVKKVYTYDDQAKGMSYFFESIR